MKISKNTWHYKVFAFWFKKKHDGYDLDTYQQAYQQETFNLCPYVRVILFWAPLYFLFSRPRIWYVLGSMVLGFLGTLYPVVGIRGLEKIGYIAGVGALAIAMMIGIIYFACKIVERWEQHPKSGIKKFSTIIVARVRAAHDGVCPLIDFVKD